MPSIIADENHLPPGFVPAKRINYNDYDQESFLELIKEHCIQNNQPLVVSNMDKAPEWNQKVFSLEQLKKYRGDEELSFLLKGRQDLKTEKLGDYVKTLQHNYHLNNLDEIEYKQKRSFTRKPRSSVTLTDDVLPLSGSTLDLATQTEESSPHDNTTHYASPVSLPSSLPETELSPVEPTLTVGEMSSPKESTHYNSSLHPLTPILEDAKASFTNKVNQTLQLETSTEISDDKYKKLKYSIDKAYAKDIDCPAEYVELMQKILPHYILPQGSNDLFSLLPTRFQATNLMCYLGQDGTGTPIHRDLCGTMGHNIMTMASPGASSEWLIVLNKDRERLAEIIKPSEREMKKIRRFDMPDRRKSLLTKSCFMESDRAWLETKKASGEGLEVQVIVQRAGDMVIIPSRAYHQVRNVGVSVKVAWNRVTPHTLACAFEDQLPLYRIINRPEVYKCKAIVSYTLKAWSTQLSTVTNVAKDLPFILQHGLDNFLQDARTLIRLYYDILSQEILSEEHSDAIPSDGPGEYFTVKCDFCHSDIFYRYYHCSDCNDYDLCMDCYTMGRSCKHVNSMTMRQGPDSIDAFIEIYRDFVYNTNRLFQPAVIQDRSQELIQAYTTPNLATICRRIEDYRRLKQDGLNTFTCGHCKKDSHTEKLASQGISLSCIFQRDQCQSVQGMLKEDVFVCQKCSKRCQNCTELKISNLPVNGYDLVYYAPPVVDDRNWGGHFDFDVEKTQNYPVRYNTRKRKLTITDTTSPEETRFARRKRA